MVKSYQQLKAESFALVQSLDIEPTKQFPVTFADGTTIYVQPAVIYGDGSYGRPDTLGYLQKHHPERVKEYQNYLNAHSQSLSAMDKEVYGQKKRHWGTGIIPL